MRATLACCVLLPLLASGAHADLGDVDTSLGEISFEEMQVSPDGSQLAFIARHNDFEKDREAWEIWTIDLGGAGAGGAAHPIRLAAAGIYSSLRWSPDGRVLSYLFSPEPAEAFQLFVLAPNAGAVPRRMTDPARFESGVDLYDWLPDSTGFVAVATESPDAASMAAADKLRSFFGDVRRKAERPPPSSSIFKVLGDGSRVERLAASPFEVPAVLSVSPDGLRLAVSGYGASEEMASCELEILPLVAQAPGAPPRRTHNLGWEETLSWAGKDLFVSVMGEEKGGRYTITEARLFRWDDEGRQLTLAAPGQEGYLKQQVPLADGSLLVTTNISTRMRVSRIEPGSGKVKTLLEQRGWIADLSASRDGKVIAFVTTDPRHYPEIFVARGLEGLAQARPVTDFNAALTRGPLPEVETFSWDAGDGTTVEGALFWPPGRKGEKGLPLIVDLHGGPFSVARTEAVSLQGSFLSFPAVLAARGFLVLNPNSRGSAGRGDAFAQGIEGFRCSRPSRDVLTGVESLVARGWADRERLGLMGYSGGGGLSKCLLGRTDLFKAVSTGAGVWNDIATFGSTRGLMWTEAFYASTSPWRDFDLWLRESPASRLDSIKTPTLIISGERDGDAPRNGDELYRGLVARGVPVESLVFPGEGHVFNRPSHKRTKMRAEISWLEHYLLGKPRAELPETKP